MIAALRARLAVALLLAAARVAPASLGSGLQARRRGPYVALAVSVGPTDATALQAGVNLGQYAEDVDDRAELDDEPAPRQAGACASTRR